MSGTRPATPQAMFTKIAPRYDIINSILTLRGDKRLRRKGVRMLHLNHNDRVLDLAAGTGEIASALAAEYRTPIKYWAVDLNENMLEVAHRKIARLRQVRPESEWDITCGSAESLRFESSTFDAVVMCFALDDMNDPSAALDETVRVLRDEGSFLLIELAMPNHGLLRKMLKFRLWMIGGIAKIFRLDPVAHMTTEVAMDRGAAHTIDRCVGAGLRLDTQVSYLGGMVRAYTFQKPRRTKM